MSRHDGAVTARRRSRRSPVALALSLAIALPAAGGSARAATASDRGPEVLSNVPCEGGTGAGFDLHIAGPDGEVPSGLQRPWLEIDFTEEPERYLWAVLESALADDGTLPWSRPRWWDEETDLNRHWYHAPWLDAGSYGRECLNGLTRERSSRPGELHDRQVDRFQNWGVAMYNAVGARTLARVWFAEVRNVPDPTAAKFDQGAVAIKLLFTEAGEDQVPHLQGAPVWRAMTHAAEDDLTGPRVERALRLVQVDVAVRDLRAGGTGWVLGSFAYHSTLHQRMLDEVARKDLPRCLQAIKDARQATSTAGEPSDVRTFEPEAVSCRGLVPIGLMWGDDDGKLWKDLDKAREHLCQTRILEERVGRPRYLGWGGRLNGPVDSGLSSCIQCHRIAEFPLRREMAPDPDWLFEGTMAQVPVGEKLDAHPLDFSLQLALGLENYCKAGHEAKWDRWPDGGRELCAPYVQVQEERAKIHYPKEVREQDGQGETSMRPWISREIRIGVLEGLWHRDYGRGWRRGLVIGIVLGAAGAALLGGTGSVVLLRRRLRRRRLRSGAVDVS